MKSIYAAFAGLAILLVLYTITNLGYAGDNPVGQATTYTQPLIVPPGWAFSIWGPIYLGLLVFPVYQVIKKRVGYPLWDRVRYWYAANLVLNGLWLVAASYDLQLLTVIIIATMLLTLVSINLLLGEIDALDIPKNYWWEQLVFSVYFAWITLATALNVSTALAYYGWEGFGLPEIFWAYLILPTVAIIAERMTHKFRAPAYALVVVWAFTGLLIKFWGREIVLTLLVGLIVVLFLWLAFRYRRRIA